MQSLILVILFVVGALPGAAMGEDVGHDDALRLKQKGEILPLERILEQVRSIHPGRIIEVELEKKGGRFIYEIELIDDEGSYWEIKVNAQDATVVSDKQEDGH